MDAQQGEKNGLQEVSDRVIMDIGSGSLLGNGFFRLTIGWQRINTNLKSVSLCPLEG